MITFRALGKLGRFGNQLFQYSGTRLYAELNNFSCAFPQWRGNKIFKNVHCPYNWRELIRSRFLPTRQLTDLTSHTRIEYLQNLLFNYRLPHTVSLEELYRYPQNNINLHGYFQTPFNIQLLLHHKNRVREWFMFKDEIDKPLKELTRKFYPWVGVHIRRGDWVKLGVAIPINKFIDTLSVVRNNRNVIICSDDPEIKKQLRSLDTIEMQNILPELHPNVFDFWLLKNAQTIIGSGSTFSWWAAYLSNQNDYYAPPTHLWHQNRSAEFIKQNVS